MEVLEYLEALSYKNKRGKSFTKKTFRTEFLNRVDEVIVFRPLTQEQIRHIVDLQIKGYRNGWQTGR